MTLLQLISDLGTKGGAIVSSKECSAMEIAAAQSVGRFSVDADGIGFVRRPAIWLAIAKNREAAHPNTDGRFNPPPTGGRDE